MEGNGYEHQLSKAVKALHTMVCNAYWGSMDNDGSSRIDCGADFVDHDGDFTTPQHTCQGCNHYYFCKANKDCMNAIEKLEAWNA